MKRLFLQNDKGGIAILFALLALPLVCVIGVGIDYAFASDRQAQLNAAADAAALSAVTPTMMAQSTSIGVTKAQAVFNSQVSAIQNLNYDPKTLNVVISTSGPVRTVTVSYTASSTNMFSGIFGRSSIPISGSAQSTAGISPNMDFYLLLDDSPSMAIAATQTDINTMVSNTSSQAGCAFACHETHPSSDSLGNPGGEDNYQLARNLGVTLRIDLLRQAAQNLMTTAQTTENSNNAHYNMAIYTFDSGFNVISPKISDLTAAKASAGNIAIMPVYANNWLTSSVGNNDEDTNYDQAMNSVNTIMPNPGSGTTVVGDTPQEVLFFVTDGVEDEGVSGSRQQSLMNPSWCNTVKSRGIRIAVLYTTYLPLPSNSWYNTYISPFQAKINPNMQTCASPGLFYEVQTGGDISAAMSSLFQLAVESAHLSK